MKNYESDLQRKWIPVAGSMCSFMRNKSFRRQDFAQVPRSSGKVCAHGCDCCQRRSLRLAGRGKRREVSGVGQGARNPWARASSSCLVIGKSEKAQNINGPLYSILDVLLHVLCHVLLSKEEVNPHGMVRCCPQEKNEVTFAKFGRPDSAPLCLGKHMERQWYKFFFLLGGGGGRCGVGGGGGGGS